MKCLSKTELKNFIHGDISADAFIEIDEHVESCPKCRADIQRLCAFPLTQKLFDTDDCPEYEVLSQFADGILPDRTTIAHIMSCEACSRDVAHIKSLRAAADLREKITVSSTLPVKKNIYVWRKLIWAPLACAIAGIIIFGSVHNSGTKNSQIATVENNSVRVAARPEKPKPASKTETQSLELAQIPAETTKEPVRQPAKTQQPKPAEKQLKTEVAPAKPVNEEPVMLAMNTVSADSAEMPLMRSEATHKAVKQSNETMTQLKWNAIDMADAYIVRIYGESGELVEESILGSNKTTYEPTKLIKGETYIWQLGVRFNANDPWQNSEGKMIEVH